MAQSERPTTAVAALIANAVIAATKFAVAAVSGSSAMLAEGIHSVVDTGNEVLLLLGVRRSRKPPDEKHPFGHGKELYFWGLIVAMVLFSVGGGMSIYEGITHVLDPHPLEDAGWNYLVLAVAFVSEGTTWIIAARALRRRGKENIVDAFLGSKDPSVFVVFAEDTAALLGLCIAFLGIFLSHFLHEPKIDGIASVLIGILLAGVSLLLARESRALLVGESARPEVVRAIRDIAQSDPAILRVDAPMTMHLGPREVLLNLNVVFRPELGAEDLARAIDGVERRIRERFPEVKRIFIEADALRPR
jgi:cation diffusion facilitator family transporter